MALPYVLRIHCHALSSSYLVIVIVVPHTCAAAIEKVNGKLISDLKVFVAKFKTRKQRMEEFEAMKKNFKNVFVKELPDDVTEEEFQTMFAEFGEVNRQGVGVA